MGKNITDEFTQACAYAANTKLVKIPSDFVYPDAELSSKSLRIKIDGFIGQAYLDVVQKFHENPYAGLPHWSNREGNPQIFYEIDSYGGNVSLAASLAEFMKGRAETVYISDKVWSSAVNLVTAADEGRVYMNAQGTLLTHKPYMSAGLQLKIDDPKLYKALHTIIGAQDGYTQEDLKTVYQSIKTSENPDADVLESLKNLIDHQESLNSDIVHYLLHQNEFMTAQCATSMVSDKGVEYSADKALKLGIVDAVIVGKDSAEITVRESDPRAQVLRQDNPDLYKTLNP